MKKASITETKNQLSALIDRVRHGETVLIMDRDNPVARLEPVVHHEGIDADGRLAHLERNGIIRRSSGGPSKLILQKRPPKIKGGSVLHSLFAERDESR